MNTHGSGKPRTIFITGGASGIGRETALLFAQRGWRIGAEDVDEAGLARLESDAGGHFTWSLEPYSSAYNVYRGDLPGMPPPYGACLLSSLVNPAFDDAQSPADKARDFHWRRRAPGAYPNRNHAAAIAQQVHGLCECFRPSEDFESDIHSASSHLFEDGFGNVSRRSACRIDRVRCSQLPCDL